MPLVMQIDAFEVAQNQQLQFPISLAGVIVQTVSKLLQAILRLFGINMSLVPLFGRDMDFQVPVDINNVFLNLTEGVSVKPIHSHNDYKRKVPLLDALQLGVKSVEADVWAYPHGSGFDSNNVKVRTDIETTRFAAGKTKRRDSDVLYVAHTELEIKDNLTLDLLYLDPIFKLLQEANGGSAGDNGVFMESPSQTLYLFIDSKNSVEGIWPLLQQKFKKFADNNYLTYYDNEKQDWIMRPLTVVLTGNLPHEQVKQMPIRYFTLDYKLSDFLKGEETVEDSRTYSLVGSSDMFDVLGSVWYQVRSFSAEEINKLNTTIQNAHKHKIMTRFWGNSNWFGPLRTKEDNILYDLGTDLLNVDDLSICSNYPERPDRE